MSDPTVQFLVPKTVAAALVARPIRGYESSTVRTPPTMARITCKRSKAVELIDTFVEMAKTGRGQIVIDCATAATAGLDAIAPKSEAPKDARSDKERGILGL